MKIFSFPIGISFLGGILFLPSLSSQATNLLQEDPYVLATGATAEQRLNLQHAFFFEESKNHLKKAGLSQGQVVLDIGCGPGDMTVYLAETVGETGHVYAFDISKEQLESAKKKIETKGLKNVTFIHQDILSQTDLLPLGKADVVYMRFLLMHIKDPLKVIRTARVLLKEGGVVVSQESIMKTLHASSSSLSVTLFNDYREALVALGEKRGVDYNIGGTLAELYKQGGYKSVVAHYLQPTINLALAKIFLSLSFNEWKPKAVGAGLMTEEKAKEFEETLKNWPEKDESFFFAIAKQAYIVAEK